ncbi:MAG TPA: hypothetical protein VHE35_07650 [Kofleriaceae bacterium]|nr:hypothetical protein [Kofleriaceae bacterium]
MTIDRADLELRLAAARAALEEDGGAGTYLSPPALRALVELAPVAAAALPATAGDERVALVALVEYERRQAAAPAAPAAADDGLPRCWFGDDPAGGPPWMFCMSADYARAVIATLERWLRAPRAPT